MASTSFAQTRTLFAYHRLATKDLEQVDRYIREKIQASRKNEERKEAHLLEAMLALYGRPNSDNLIEKVSSGLTSELRSTELFEPVTKTFITEALSAIKNKNNDVTPDAVVTYLIMLENWILEFKSQITDSEVEKFFVQIREAKIQITSMARQASQTHMPYRLVNPSDLASRLLKELEQQRKEDKKRLNNSLKEKKGSSDIPEDSKNKESDQTNEKMKEPSE